MYSNTCNDLSADICIKYTIKLLIVIFIGIPAFLIMARPFDISNKYDINKPAVLLCEKCIIIFTMTEKIIT